MKTMKPVMMMLVAVVLLAAPVLSAVAGEIEDRKTQLSVQIELINSIEPFVERIDLARLFVLKRASETVFNSIDKNGLGNAKTFQEYQKLIVAYRYSIAFMEQIRSVETTDAVAGLLQINDLIIKEYGFDDSPYTKITSSVFNQIYELIKQIRELNLSPALQEGLAGLLAPVGKTIAIADQGDRPRTFEAAEPVYFQISALYPLFDEVAMSDVAFNLIMEIQGLNEFYAEYAQIEGNE